MYSQSSNHLVVILFPTRDSNGYGIVNQYLREHAGSNVLTVGLVEKQVVYTVSTSHWLGIQTRLDQEGINYKYKVVRSLAITDLAKVVWLESVNITKP